MIMLRMLTKKDFELRIIEVQLLLNKQINLFREQALSALVWFEVGPLLWSNWRNLEMMVFMEEENGRTRRKPSTQGGNQHQTQLKCVTGQKSS